LYDVVIVGAGVSGAFVARELSKCDLKVCLLEKGHDVASGSSKANSGIIHAGYDCVPGSLKALLNVRGSKMMEKIASELDVPYKKTGSFVVGYGEQDKEILQELFCKGHANGVEDLQIIDRETLSEMEPQLSGLATHALYAPTAGIICPYELTAAAVENAVENGVELYRSCEVKSISFYHDYIKVGTNIKTLDCRYFVNAAGIYSGEVAAMAGDDSIEIKPRKGEYMLLDKSVGKTVKRVIFQCPTPMGKGILVTPTVDGNLMIGPDAQDIVDQEDNSTTEYGLELVTQGAKRAVPDLDISKVITSFAGIRARPAAGDFIISPSKVNSHIINVAGIESPGLTCAPAIGEYVSNLLRRQGLQMVPKRNHKNYRDKVIRFRELKDDEKEEILMKNPSYGRLVCRCEKVTEGEVIDCIRRPAGALDLDAVKRRTRAGMGRCQGGFCTPRLVELLSRELGIPYEEVTKNGGDSWLLAGKTK